MPTNWVKVGVQNHLFASISNHQTRSVAAQQRGHLNCAACTVIDQSTSVS